MTPSPESAVSDVDYAELRERFGEIARNVVLDEVSAIESYQWPARTMRALAEAGLYGLTVSERYGGLGMGMTGVVIAGEELGRVSASASLCYCMHTVGAAVLSAKPTAEQAERYVVPIAENRHFTTLALSEPGTGAHFYEPATRLTRSEAGFIVDGAKTFVTNGGHCDSYVISTMSAQGPAAPGLFNCLVVDADTPGLRWVGEWQGLGMRGNSSIRMELENARVRAGQLLGEEGDQTWYVFNVVAPYFLMAMAATYLGVAESALELARAHVRERSYVHTNARLADVPAVQTRLAGMWLEVNKARALIYQAAERGDMGTPDALPSILAAKIAAAEAAVAVTNEAMTCVGGTGYRENSLLWTLLRDARAAHVMSPTSDLLTSWLGRELLGLPLLEPHV